MFLLYVQAVSTFACFIIGFLISIPIGLNRSKHDGQCLLYANLEIHGPPEDGLISKNLLPGSRLTCDFCIFSGTVSLIIGLVLLIATIYTILQNGFKRFNLTRYIGDREKRKNNKPLIGAWINFCSAAVMALLTFVTACLISSGFHEFCEQGLKNIHKADLGSCDLLESYVGPFYKQLTIAQVSAWLGALFWIILTVTGRMNVRNMRPKRTRLMADDGEDYQQIESPTHL